MDVIVAEVNEHSADTASFTAELLSRMHDPSPDANVELLLSDVGNRRAFVSTVTRILAAIGFIMNPPVATVAYLAVVFLVPSRSVAASKPKVDEEFRKAAVMDRVNTL